MLAPERLKDMFCNMVKIDSLSKEERLLADYVKDALAGLGLEVWEDRAGCAIGGNAGNVIGRLPGRAGAPTILLTAHLDRVKPGKGIEPVLKGGCYYSAGDTILAADDISGVAAVLEMLHMLKESNEDHCSLLIVFTVAEEIGLLGVKNLDKKEIKADFGYALDSNGLVGDIIVQAPTQNKINIKIIGKPSHAGVNPEEGINAVKIAGEAITKTPLGRIDEATTANIGIINGGQATNIVPDLVTMEAEARSHTRERLDQYTELMEKTFQEIVNHYHGKLEFQWENLYPAFKFTENDPVVLRCVAAFERLDWQCKQLPTGGGSDANLFNGMGIPTLNLATGMQKVHSKDEYIPYQELEKLTKLLVELVRP